MMILGAMMRHGKMVLGKLTSSPNSNVNLKPNLDPDRGAIFLGGNFPNTGKIINAP